MMQRKIFYSTIQKDGITGIRKQDGYELKIDGEKFNAYTRTDDRVYILDPRNGIALIAYDYQEWNEDIPIDIELIDKAKEKLIKSGILKKWKEKKKKESYQLTIQMFEAYKKAEFLREKQQEVEHREIEEEISGSGGR